MISLERKGVLSRAEGMMEFEAISGLRKITRPRRMDA